MQPSTTTALRDYQPLEGRIYVNDLEQIEAQFHDLNARLNEWQNIIDEEFKRVWNGRYDGESLKAAHDRAVRKVGEQPLEEVYTFLDGLCSFYLEATPEPRDRIRSLFEDKRGMWSVLY